MRGDLEAKLKEEFPTFFRDMYGPVWETCMHWGCECGDGWFSLVRHLCLGLQSYLKERPDFDFKFSQVKEKFGLLRIYSEGGDERTKALIKEVQDTSSEVCEECGRREGVIHDNRSTLCSFCRETRLQRRG